MISAAEETSIVKIRHHTGVFTVILYSNDIIEVQWDKKLKEIDKSHLVELNKAIRTLGEGRKILTYISILDFLCITAEGREYAASEEGQEFTFANAILIDNLAKKLTFNFFMNVNQPKTPTKAFKTKQQAFHWLLSQKKHKQE